RFDRCLGVTSLLEKISIKRVEPFCFYGLYHKIRQILICVPVLPPKTLTPMRTMKIKSLIFFCFITAQSFLCAQQEPEGWVWMSLPWYYSPQDQSWFAMYPKGERLWVWNADEKYWNLKWSKSGWN